MKIIVAGSRNWDWYAVYKKTMLSVVSELQYKFVVPTRCIDMVYSSNYGVDVMTKRFCEEYNLKQSVFTVDWSNMTQGKVLAGVTKGGAPYNRMAGVNSYLDMVKYANTFDENANSFKKSANTLKVPILVTFKDEPDKLVKNLIDKFIKDKNPVYEFSIQYGVQLKLKTHNHTSVLQGMYK